MKRFVGLAIVCSLIIGLSISCQRPPSQVTMRTMEDADHVVAKGKGGLRFTLEQLYRSVARTKAEHNGGIYDSSRVRRHLDSMLVDSLIGLEAHQVDVQKYRKPWRTFNAQRRTVLVNEFRQANIYDVFDLDSADVIEFYNEREDLFVVPELAYIYHVSVSEPDLRAYVERTEGLELKPEQVDSAAEVRINDIYDQISDRETFLDQVVKHRATEVPFTRAGDLGWTRHDQYLDPFDSVAFALDSGMYSEPYRDDNGWNVLYCDGRIPAGLPPLDDTLFQVARVTLQTDLANKRAPVVADSLAGLMDLTLRSDGLLDSNVYLVDRWEWAAIINDRDTIFFADLRGLEEKFRHRYGVDNTSAQMKEEMAEMLAGSYVTTYVAEDQGLDTLPPMKRLLDSLYHVYQKGIMLRDLEIGDWTPTDSAIEAYYQAHIDEYQFDKPLVVQQIVVSDSVLAEFVRDQATAGYQFMDLARDYHEPDTTSPAFLAADLGAVGPDDIPPDIYRAMRAAPLRVPSNLYHSDFGWHLFYVLERHRSRTLLDATGEIKLILKDQKEREIFTTVRDSLFEQYNVSTADKLPTFHLPPYTQRDPVFE